MAAEERRTVTIVFADLVGFTERSDRADPEDVRRTLVPFHRRVKEDLERFGGTLDKFIGDAVMGVFGAPVAHEDDPVRAVRAALRILDTIEDLRRDDPDIAVRIAVNTGEAVVSFGSGPQVGEAVAGDVVNTTSRMQSLAPRDAVVIGEETLRAVRGRFEVEALPTATVKGKSEPLMVWQVLGERAEPERERVPFVGRRTELGILTERFDDVERSGSLRALVLVADAGVGKSRLVAELANDLGERALPITGSCPPYGEGVTFAPVEQIVRALTGIEPSDDVATSAARLEAHAARIELDPQDRWWLVRTLGAVLALETISDGATIGTEEIARAWALLLGAAAGSRPLVLAVEDLHHAAPALLEVLASTAELLADRPVLILASARPEAVLPEGWATLYVGALAEAETRELIGSLLGERAVSGSVLERAAGNPLYAIEFARMLAESGAATGDATPASVHAVISARLDMVPTDARGLAQDAAVLGDEVWPEALEGLHDHDAPAGLEELVRRGLLERRTSSLPGLDAYGFTHALIREVAYGRLPRSARATRHLAAARWLEEVAGERAEEWAESLARHYASAAELGLAANEPEVAETANGPALRWLLAAGERAARVDPAAAFATFDRALALAPLDTRGREEALWRSAHAARRAGLLDAEEVLDRYRQALAIAKARDDDIALGEALTRMGTQLAVAGESARSREAFAESIETLERHPPGLALARAYAFRAEEELFTGDTADAAAFADRALEILEDHGNEIAVMALHIRGDARCSMRISTPASPISRRRSAAPRRAVAWPTSSRRGTTWPSGAGRPRVPPPAWRSGSWRSSSPRTATCTPRPSTPRARRCGRCSRPASGTACSRGATICSAFRPAVSIPPSGSPRWSHVPTSCSRAAAARTSSTPPSSSTSPNGRRSSPPEHRRSPPPPRSRSRTGRPRRPSGGSRHSRRSPREWRPNIARSSWFGRCGCHSRRGGWTSPSDSLRPAIRSCSGIGCITRRRSRCSPRLMAIPTRPRRTRRSPSGSTTMATRSSRRRRSSARLV